MGRLADHHGKHQGVECAPSVETSAVDLESMSCLAQRDAIPDDVAIIVKFRARFVFEQRRQSFFGQTKCCREHTCWNWASFCQFA